MKKIAQIIVISGKNTYFWIAVVRNIFLQEDANRDSLVTFDE